MFKIKFYRKLSANIIFYKVLRIMKKIYDCISNFYNYKRDSKKESYLSDAHFLKDISSKNEKIDYKKIFELTENNIFFKSLLNKEDKELINSNNVEKSKVVSLSDEICNHKFKLLGSGKVKVYYNLEADGLENYKYYFPVDDEKLDEIINKTRKKISSIFNDMQNNVILDYFEKNYKPIDWHIDFKSGYRWDSKLWYKKVRYGKFLGADIKVPWELSRFYHFITLGQAYLLTGNEKYTKEFVCQVIDWIENNPPHHGVNWVCTMDVAIRVCNWILGFSFFKNSDLINKKFEFEFLKNLYIHGKHIIGNLEYGILTSNHYISDIVGLTYLGIIFKDFKGVRNWLDFSVNELVGEIKKQVYQDGVDFEASTCYHRLVLELFFYPTLFIIKNSSYFNKNNFVEAGEKIFGKNYIKKLYKMFEFVLSSLKPNGKMPQLGDNDSGRLHIFWNREVLDMRYLLCLGAVFFKEPKFKVKEFGFCEEVLWVFGKDGYDIWNNLESISINSVGSRSFPNAGWYILRKDKNYMIVSCGPNGQNGNGGHAHNDKLNFELSVGGKDILVDPGTYIYTPIPYWRNKFRSTLFHNTVVVDGVEQNRFSDKSLFFLENDAKCKVNLWKTTERYDFLDCEHYGYKRLKNPVIHRRQIFYDKNEDYWIVRDLLTGEGKHKFDWCFHIAKSVIFDIDENTLTVTINDSFNDKKNIRLKLIPLVIGGFKFFKINSWLSYGYGEKVSSIMLGYSKTTDTPTDFLFIITTKKFNYSKDDVVNLLESYSK